MKITYANGFHVNTALTSVAGVNLEENVFQRDFEQWRRSIQPVIDENALAPSAFTLIESMFDQSCISLKTFKKIKVYMGRLPERDYSYLDYSLLDLEPKVRRYAQSNFMTVDNQLKEYLRLKYNHEDAFFVGNMNQYFDFLFEKKQYLRTLLKAKQMKRVVMILLSGKPLPMDLDGYQEVLKTF